MFTDPRTPPPLRPGVVVAVVVEPRLRGVEESERVKSVMTWRQDIITACGHAKAARHSSKEAFKVRPLMGTKRGGGIIIMVQNSLILRHQIIHFPVSERAIK